MKRNLGQSQSISLPKIGAVQRGRVQPSYSTLYYAKAYSKILDTKDEAKMFKDILSNSSGEILTKIEQKTNRTFRSSMVSPMNMKGKSFAELAQTKYHEGIRKSEALNTVRGEERIAGAQRSFCKFCKHCQSTSLGVYKVKQVIKPYLEGIIEEENKSEGGLPAQLIKATKMKDYFLREGIEGKEENKWLDLTVEMLLERQIDVRRVIEKETLAKLSQHSLFTAMSFFERKDIQGIIDEVTRILKKSKLANEVLKSKEEAKTKVMTILKGIKSRLQNRASSDDELYSVAIFSCIQELIRMFTLNSKERGTLLIKALSSFFNENEEKWLQLVESLVEIIGCLEAELQSVLDFVKIKPGVIDVILKKNEATMENLVEHKHIMRELVATLQKERAKRLDLETETEMLRKQLDLWLVDWETLKVSSRITDKLKEFTKVDIQNMFLMKKELKEDERALTLNIERLLLALPGEFRFTEEREEYKAQLRKKDEENEKLQRICTTLRIDSERLREENAKLLHEVELCNELSNNTFQQLRFKKLTNAETQTDPEELAVQKDLANYLQGTGTEIEFASILKQAKEKTLKVQCLPLEELLKYLKLFYSQIMKKCVEDSIEIASPFSLFQQLIRFLWERYELKGIILQKSKEILRSTGQYTSTDVRIESFAQFIGMKEERCAPEAPIIYLKLLQCLQFESFFGKDWNASMPFEDACGNIKKIVKNGTKKFNRDMKQALFTRASIRINRAHADIVTTKTAAYFWIMYKLNKSGKKKRLMKFMETFFEKSGHLTQKELVLMLKSMILTVVKQSKEEDVLKFIEGCYMQNSKLVDQRVVQLLKDEIEIAIDFGSYLRVALGLTLQYIDQIKRMASKFVSQYGKSKKGYLSIDEVSTLLNDKITDMKESWRIVAFMEATFRGAKLQEISETEFATLLLNTPLLNQLVTEAEKEI